MVQIQDCANFLIVGVGGQGTLLAADVIAAVGVRLGFDVKKSEIHGMAQRGGSVSSQVRWGKQVYSPVFTPGEADYLVALERLEALRFAHWLRAGGLALVSQYRINPVSVTTGESLYPDEAFERQVFHSVNYCSIPAMRLAEQVGQSKANNIVLLGVLCAELGYDTAIWGSALEECIPSRFLQVNLAAFAAGRAYAESSGGE